MVTILYFQGAFSEMSTLMAAGVRYAAECCGWKLHVVPYANAVPRDMRDRANVCTRHTLANILATWHPDGCIVEHSVPNNLPPHSFGNIPIVYLDRAPSARDENICVFYDEASCVKIAANELFALRLGHFAYVPWITRTPYSVARKMNFERLVAKYGGTLATCNEADAGHANSLRTFLMSLPLPCGILACNDFIARKVADAAAVCGLSVPDDLCIVGIDNDTTLCENGSVSLSSVRRDNFGAGEAAVRLLGESISNPEAKPHSVSQHAVELVRRQSTRRFPVRNPKCQRAVEYVRLHAAEGIAVADVAAAMGLPLRSAQRLFRNVTGKSMRDELRDARFELAKHHLMNKAAFITGVADFAGYGNDSTVRKLFHARLGVSLRACKKGAGG